MIKVKNKLFYVIADTSPFEFPCVVCATLQECAEWLNVSRETLKTAIRRHGKYRGKKFQVIRVRIDE